MTKFVKFRYTKRTPMLWFERFYGAGPFEVDRVEKHLVFLKLPKGSIAPCGAEDIPDKHNGWHKERFEVVDVERR